jgi:uncharacterized protein (DUF58 family)
MSKILNNLRLVMRIYAVALLVTAAVRSSPALAFVPVILLVWFLYQWRWPSSQLVDFLTQYFVFFAAGLLLSAALNPYLAVLITLPLIVPIDLKLRDIGRATLPDAAAGKRSVTNIGQVLIGITAGLAIIGLLVGSTPLLLACAAIFIYFLIIAWIIRRRLPTAPVDSNPIQLRALAGRETKTGILLKTKSKISGMLFLESPYPWFKAAPNAFIPLGTGEIPVNVLITPPLAGPTEIKLDACAIDPWGLSQIRFEISALKLVVIPRATYADYMARQYLSGSKTGRLPLVSSVGAIQSLYGLRQGIEFYGNRMYQPGDNLKNIDWKHSVKYNELVTKEFFEVQGQPVIMLVNLVTGSAEESDKLAYNIIAASLSLAQDGIPTAIAAYDDQEVVLSTRGLAAQELLVRALEVVKEIVQRENTAKSLSPPDVARLRANIRRLGQTESHPAAVLRELLQIELKSLNLSAQSSPCTAALREVMMKTDRQSTLVVISRQNHDAEALAFNLQDMAMKGNAVISV